MKKFLLVICLIFNIFNASFYSNEESYEYNFKEAELSFVIDETSFKENKLSFNINIDKKYEEFCDFMVRISFINKEFVYSYLNDNSLIFTKLLEYYHQDFLVEVNLNNIINTFEILIEYTYNSSLNQIRFPFSSNNIYLSETTNLIDKVELKNKKLKIYKTNFNILDSKLFSNLIYYDCLKFNYLNFKIDNLISLENVYLKIKDEKQVFKNITSYIGSFAVFLLIINVKNKDEGIINSSNNEAFYMDIETFLLNKTKELNYKNLTKNIYFPNGFYDYFLNSDGMISFKNLNNRYNIDYLFKIEFENDFRCKEASIYESNERII